ncbi:hypothetical protein SERLA73DRAFT_161195 [Serpula lacrymans var. lacrymans S7.3]|uniref:Uncharacterized protein n=1 Tax=Serpula lacrymans var. lacrymans (strain S7.3) TaxID=936435 RepID=F8PZT7_SERL3|nr:hypothetical protein SERLA73DRAFT_161195 [Serpula lacrymans var. lacrymans S7.3]
MLSTAARPISPGPSPLNPIRFSSQSQASTVSQQRSATISKTLEPWAWVAERTRRSSIQSSHVKNTSAKGKERSLDSADSSSFGYVHESDADPFVSTHYNPSTSFTSYESSSLPRSPITPTKKPRASLLLAASDALGFKFGRKRKSVKQIPQPVIMPEVIEISAPRRDEEGEERERLRDAAAQSIGIDPDLLQSTQSRDEDILEDEEDFISDDGGITDGKHAALDTLTAENSVYDTAVLPYDTMPSPHHTGPLLSITLPKFYPPSSLLVYALSKQWKSRFMVFSSPIISGQIANVSYLHLFKSSSLEEKELERMEINENSVIFVAEEEVAGRGDVIKIGGIDVGAMRKDLNHEEAGRTLWLLQIPGVSDSQRSMRAGLGAHAHTASGVEPRGDMDVMLSMRLQGIISSSSATTKKTTSAESNSRPTSHIGHGRPVSPPASRPTSLQQASRSPTIASKSSTHTVSTLKGMFGTRPRSSSRSTSIDQDRDTTEDSFGAMGNNLLTMLRTNGTGDVSMTPTHPASTSSSVPSLSSSIKKIIEATPSLAPADQRLDIKIMKERQSPPKMDSPRSSQGHSLPIGSLSLQPPPRKKLWSIPSITTSQDVIPHIYHHSDGNRSVAGSFGIQTTTSVDRSQSPASPALTVQSSIPEQRERAASLQSESTHTSTEISILNRSTSSVKRWSRQANIPKQLTPPTGPPPSVPPSRAQTPQYGTNRPNSWLKAHPYAAERPPSRTSSQHSGLAPQIGASLSPNFWKRTSDSSVYSESGVSTSSPRLPTPRTGSTKRQSMPPPRPAPTFAPPPAPSESQALARHDSLPPKSFRNSVAQRALRLSLTAPKPPPSSDLPPRPDEPGYKTHRRSSSSGNNPSLYSIPGSPTPITPPFPAPTVPLPPPPSSNSSSRSSTIKQRLRILSTPSAGPLPPPEAYAPHSPSIPSMIDAYSPPSTPIGERITTMQNDPSFLQLVTPVSPSIPKLPPRNPNRPSISECLPSSPEIMSLSPPPRRGSRQMSEKIPNQDKGESETQSSESSGENKLATLSQRGSVISLGIVTM